MQGTGIAAHPGAVTLATRAVGEPANEPSLVDGRLVATARWLETAAASTYSIQLLGTNDEEQLKDHLNTLMNSIEINSIFVYRTTAKGKPTLNVLYGTYGDQFTAQRALSQLPTVQGIRREIKLQPRS